MMYLNPGQSRDWSGDTPDDEREDEITTVIEHSITTIERQKSMVQEAIQTQPVSVRGLVSNRRHTSWLEHATDDGADDTLKATLHRLEQKEEQLRARKVSRLLQQQQKHRHQHQHEENQHHVDGSYSFLNPVHGHGRTGLSDHHQCRSEPLPPHQQWKQREFDDDDDDEQWHTHTRRSLPSSSYFSSPTARSTAAAAIAFTEACYLASIVLAEPPSAFSRETNHASNRRKCFFFAGCRRDRYERRVAGRRVTGSGEMKSDDGVAVFESTVKTGTCDNPIPPRKKSRRRWPWWPTFMCWVDCGSTSYDTGGGGRGIETRTRAGRMGSIRQLFMGKKRANSPRQKSSPMLSTGDGRAKDALLLSARIGSRGSSRDSHSARWDPSRRSLPFQPRPARGPPAIGSTSGCARVDRNDEQPLVGPQSKKPPPLFPPAPTSTITDCSGASPTMPAAAVATPPPKPGLGPPAVLKSAGATSGNGGGSGSGGVCGDGDDEQPQAGLQWKNSPPLCPPLQATWVAKSSCASATTPAAATPRSPRSSFLPNLAATSAAGEKGARRAPTRWPSSGSFLSVDSLDSSVHGSHAPPMPRQAATAFSLDGRGGLVADRRATCEKHRLRICLGAGKLRGAPPLTAAWPAANHQGTKANRIETSAAGEKRRR